MLLATRQLPPTTRHHRPATDREGSPQSGAADGRAAISDPIRKAPPTVDIVLPVYNEENDLAPSVRKLRAYLDRAFPLETRITIVDNASTDRTWLVATSLEREVAAVRAMHLDQKGRGRALRAAWLASDAEIVAYMDVDLSTSLDALLPLVAPLLSGHSEIAIGSRLLPGSRVVRGLKREVISRSYNAILRTVVRARFRDAQCGFKAARSDVVRQLLPLVEDEAWFFDTELLLLAQRAGLRIHEVPVDWVDDPDSRVDIVATATADLRGVWRLLRSRRRVELAGIGRPAVRSIGSEIRSFVTIGVASTVAYVLLYSGLRSAVSAALANAIALVVTAIANTAANRRLTFGVVGRASLLRDHAAGLAAFGFALAITTGAVWLLELIAPNPGRAAEIVVLVAANALATVSRFVLLRSWISRARRSQVRPSDQLEGSLS
jgi:glycosyltransferase involved in cell wall biosynthesis